MKFTFVLIAFLGLLLNSLPAKALSLNDLSVLVPLPEVSQLGEMLSPGALGEQGRLIPTEVFKVLPQLVPEYDNAVTYRDQLKVVGLRLDPCFTEGVGPQRCRRQIRLVWQPVIAASDVVSTRDAAVHSFYEFDEATFNQVWSAWQKFASGDATEGLQIHPQIRQEGLAGVHWQYLKSLVLKFCGERNLVRVTAMNVMSGEQLWIFMGFDVMNGKTQPIQIARIDRSSQGVIISSEGFKNFNGRVMPPPNQDPDWVLFIADSIGVKKYSSEAQIKALMGRVHEFENPTKHNPGTLDCVSCHVANSAHQWGLANFLQWDWQKEFQQVAYQSSRNLQNVTQGPLRTNQLRAFGYFKNQPAISQRVINETAAVMDQLPLR